MFTNLPMEYTCSNVLRVNVYCQLLLGSLRTSTVFRNQGDEWHICAEDSACFYLLDAFAVWFIQNATS